MIDLNIQKTFIKKGKTTFITIGDLFRLRAYNRVDFMTLWMYDEVNKSWQYCCRVDTLQELETEYNKRSNNLFEWK